MRTAAGIDAPLAIGERPGEAVGEAGPERAWRILVVDDDREVHAATEFALSGANILGRPLEFLHAYSAAEAEQILRAARDIAVVLLDVVMERADAGLELVRTIRGTLGNADVRVILRTGQPGYAPEIDAVREYDINDYKTKAELSRGRLYTALTTAIRSYDQIHALNRNRRGLDLVIGASRTLMARQGIRDFTAATLIQMSELLGGAIEGFICSHPSGQEPEMAQVFAANGRFTVLHDQPVSALADARARQAMAGTLRARRSAFADDSATLYIRGKMGPDIGVHLRTGRALDEIERRLLDVYCANISVALGNVYLVELLQDQAKNDQLLRLPNRLAFIQIVDLARQAGLGSQTVALLDIDHFSQINAALGHGYGDSLLVAVKERLVASLPAACRLARIGEDTFAVLGADQLLQPPMLFEPFRSPFIVEGGEYTVSVSIGLARLSDVDGDGSDALKAANIALKQSKEHARGEYCYFTRSMEYETRSRVKLMQDLCVAFQRDRLFMVYQPQFNLATRRIVGVEALLRWRAENGEFVPPDQFIPIAERSGVIIALGAWVMRTACHAQTAFQRALGVDLRVAVNVSVPQFRHPDFLANLDAILAQTRCLGEHLELEITESVAMLDPDFIIRLLAELKRRKITIAIDDFGTGFSSLSYLARLSVDRLKIDRSFVGQLMQNDNNRRIAETVVALGRGLDLTIVAEGIETEEQVDALARMGCQEGQGFLFARPLLPDDLVAFVRNHRAGEPAR